MSTPSNPLAAGVPALQPPSATQIVVAPDGTPGEIPIDRVQDAVSKGFKMGMKMTAPDGTTGVVSVDNAHDAVAKGLKPAGVTTTAGNSALGSLHSAGQAAGDFAKGAGEGAVQSMGNTIQGLPWIGQKIISPEGMAAERAAFAPGSAAEKNGQLAGKIAEPVLEFVAGDAALKGLSIGDKVAHLNQIREVIDSSPYIGKLMQHGVLLDHIANAARMGTVEAGEDYLRNRLNGGTFGQALQKGAVAGVTGEALSSIPEIRGAVGKVNPFRTAPTIADAEPGIVTRLTQGADVAQAPAQAATRTALQTAGSDVGLNTVQGAGLRTAAQEPIAALRAAKQAAYGQVDAAAGTDLKGLFDRMDKIEDAIDQTAPGSPDEAKYEAARTSLQQTIDDAKAEANSKLQGTDADTLLKRGDVLHTRESALRELQKKVLQNVNIVSGNAAAGTPESLDLDSAIKALQKMQDDTRFGAPRLAQALGSKDAAKQFLDDLYASQRRGVRAISTQQFIKKLGVFASKLTGAAGVGAVGYDAYKLATGGN